MSAINDDATLQRVYRPMLTWDLIDGLLSDRPLEYDGCKRVLLERMAKAKVEHIPELVQLEFGLPFHLLHFHF